MGLQVWLPLNGNLGNKGLSNITVTQSNTAIDTNGKIGSCYSFNGTDSFISLNDVYNILKGGNNPFSITMWVYNSDTSNRAVLFGDYNIAYTTYTNLIEKKIDEKIRFYWKGGNPDLTFNSTLTKDNWTHLGLTYNGQEICIYINGQFSDSKQISLSSLNKISGSFYIGRDGRTGTTAFNGKINDFRLYDEALSPMQIKLISQGLVAHYLLDNNGISNNFNLLKKQIKETAWGLWGYGDATREKVTIDNKVWAHIIQDDTTRYDGYSINPNGNGIVIDHNQQYIISFTAKGGNNQPNSEIIVWWHWRSTEGGANLAQHYVRINISDKIPRRYSCIIPKYTHDTYNVDRINIMMGSHKANNEIYFTDVKFEEGDIATYWIPNEEDPEYANLGLNDNIEYDVSGYCHNGVKYNITDYSSDTPRYSVSTTFNGTNSYINIGKGGKVKDAITVSSWVYMNDWSTYSNPFISCTQTGGWNFSKNGSNLRFLLGTGTTSNTNKNAQVLLSSLTSGWHMITATYDGLVVSLYIDGILTHGNTIYSTKTPIYYNATNDIIIGAEAGSGATPTGEYFNGRISDVRIYATALSDTDVLALYKNSAYIDSFGNVFASEYQEE